MSRGRYGGWTPAIHHFLVCAHCAFMWERRTLWQQTFCNHAVLKMLDSGERGQWNHKNTCTNRWAYDCAAHALGWEDYSETGSKKKRSKKKSSLKAHSCENFPPQPLNPYYLQLTRHHRVSSVCWGKNSYCSLNAFSVYLESVWIYLTYTSECFEDFHE